MIETKTIFFEQMKPVSTPHPDTGKPRNGCVVYGREIGDGGPVSKTTHYWIPQSCYAIEKIVIGRGYVIFKQNGYVKAVLPAEYLDGWCRVASPPTETT